jgi:type IX secretion system PorP/SprF family membrane protein
LPPPGSTKSVPDLGLGFYLTSENYYLGLSATHLIPMTVDVNGAAEYDIARHYYFLAGYDYDITEDFSLRANMFTKTDGVSLQTDLNINTFFKENYWTGVSFRYEDALCFLAGFQIANNLTFAYAFDLITSKLSSQANGSHELFLRYSFELDIIGRGESGQLKDFNSVNSSMILNNQNISINYLIDLINKKSQGEINIMNVDVQ